MLTLQDASNNVEIVKVTARTAGADSMTIARAQEGFTDRSWNIGDVVELRVTAFALNPLSVFAGAATAQAMRDAMAAPSRTGGDASGTWSIDISGNAATATNPSGGGSFVTSQNIGSQSVNYASSAGSAEYASSAGSAGSAGTVTNGVYTTGNQTIDGIKTFTSGVRFNDGTSQTTTAGVAKAWVNFDGRTGAIRASFNVSSVRRDGVGTYTVIFSTHMPDMNYVFVGSAGSGFVSTNGLATNYAGVSTGSSSVSTDPWSVYVAIFR
jgi:hypothetical protein